MLLFMLACTAGGKQAQIDDIGGTTTEPSEPSPTPSQDPATEPSSNPAREPTSSPTTEPTTEPSQEPAQEPAQEPVFVPIDTDVFSNTQKLIAPVNGFIDVPVPLSSQATSVMVALRGRDETVIYEVVAPDGSIVFQSLEWYGTSQMITSAIYTSQTGERAFNWPIRGIDSPLSQGEWIFTFFSNDFSPGSANVDIMVKRDNNLNSGTLKVLIGYTTELSYVQDFHSILNQSIAVWEEIYGAYGISLEIDIIPTQLSGSIPSPFVGSLDYYSLNGQGDYSDILVVIGENIAGATDQFGITGSIPGTTSRHRIGAVALSWLYAAGPDGEFDSVDIRLLGETLAHEVGHYMGLPHPVESSWFEYDALGDTANCTNQTSCESIFQTNIMFPYPICDALDCIEQTEITSNQEEVWHRYIGVD